MATDNMIIWKKWIDPFDDETEDSDDIESLEDETDSNLDDKPTPQNAAGPVLVGPMGIIPLNEHNMPSKVFNFWMGHTNFDLGINEKNILDQVPGVETLEIYTRYRFRMSVGIAFDEDVVMKAVETALIPNKVKTEQASTAKVNGIDKLKHYLCNHYKFWAIFILPNGEMDYKTGDTQDSVNEKIASYPNKAEVLTSWEVSDGSKKNGNGRGISSSPIK